MEKPTFVYATYIRTTPEKLWAALTSGPSRVTYELTPMGNQVRFRLIHENLLPGDMETNPDVQRGINNGWPAVLSSLKSLLETGEAIAFPSN